MLEEEEDMRAHQERTGAIISTIRTNQEETKATQNEMKAMMEIYPKSEATQERAEAIVRHSEGIPRAEAMDASSYCLAGPGCQCSTQSP
jgi:hypothetical protein